MNTVEERTLEIFFCADPRYYDVRGKKVKISVTSIVGAMWPAKSTAKMIGGMRKRGTLAIKYPGMTARDVAREWDRISSEACRLGTLMHEAIHCMLSGQPCTRETHEVEIELEMARQFIAEQVEMKELQIFRTELPIFYDDPVRDLVIPGSVDCLAKDKDGNITLFDWKRSTQLERAFDFSDVVPELEDSKFNHYSLQLSLYAVILRRCYRLNVTKMFIVVFHPENPSYRMIPAADLTKLAETELIGRYDFYRARAEQNDLISRQNKKMLL